MWQSALSKPGDAEMMLGGSKVPSAYRFGNVWILLQIPCIIDRDGTRETVLEVPSTDIMLVRGLHFS
jgi:hypothetical protein